MARKNYTVEQIIVKLRKIEVLCVQGSTIAKAVRQEDITEQTYYRWRKQCGAMRSDDAQKLKMLKWKRTVLRHTFEYVDYLSLHTYYSNNDNDIASFPANNIKIDRFIKEVGTICNEIKEEKGSKTEIKLSFNEWNIWYHFKRGCEEPAKRIEARPLEEKLFDFADMLLVGSMLITLLNKTDIVKSGAIGQYDCTHHDRTKRTHMDTNYILSFFIYIKIRNL